MTRLSIPKDKIRFLFLEGIHDNAIRSLNANGYTNIETHPGAPDAETLIKLLPKAHVIGIRSRTKITQEVLSAAERLFCIGCFCIGTNQVDLKAAKLRGVPVFNAPYSNTRSVAELVIGEIIMLFRRVVDKSAQAHAGVWKKTIDGSREIRGRVLGIVGYGHIGSQVSILAEALGMQVRYYDIVDKLAIGNARSCASLAELLETADVVSLHVPGTLETRNMIGVDELGQMKPGSFLVNASRGDVVDHDALASALRAGHVAGSAVDVFPAEPADADEPLETPLRGLPNVILTPHVGGSTEEAQANIGTEVAEKLIKYSDNGSTIGAVNFVEVSLPVQRNVTRFLHIHRNVPGVMAHVNEAFSTKSINIAGQYLRTDSDVGYAVTDIDSPVEAGMGIRRHLQNIEGTIRVRFLH